jgi:hypothetical protein
MKYKFNRYRRQTVSSDFLEHRENEKHVQIWCKGSLS